MNKFKEQVIHYTTLSEATDFLPLFEQQTLFYKQTFERQVNANKQYTQILNNARMYISHFIQVLNLAVIRGEIKKELKQLYNLNPENHAVPDLSTEYAILEWGQNIINGENKRTRNGGLPIYNPTIARVSVHYENFKDYKRNQKLAQNRTNQIWNELVSLRTKGDKIIRNIWDEVEAFYKDESPYNRLMKCKQYGLIYYYRKGEKILTPECDIDKE